MAKKQKYYFFLGLFLTFILLSFSVFLTSNAGTINFDSPVGQWITIDPHTKKPSGIVEIAERQGNLYGKIIEGFNVDPLKFCINCPGELKNKPVVGLTFLWGFSPDGKNSWKNGTILNPHDGAVYRGSIILSDHGKKLLLRGYWGLFFQTETWMRKGV